ncbi:di-trans,poly-cis-decaprenylcistransferase [Candidatus Micrarchaeota archaeon]|nr:di-trans,poly-cis-decaprenylcistransferase [Candidatus Micrarchaeota archaeon]
MVNRRWAVEQGISRQEGYQIGIRKIGDVVKWCKEQDVKMLTMWGFSTDNFKRDPSEIRGLFELFKKNLQEGLAKVDKGEAEKEKKQVKVRFFGRIHLLPKEIQQMIKTVEDQSGSKDAKYQLNLLLSYGGREELVDAINQIIKEGIKEVSEQTISEHLYTRNLPDPDLIIRTSGEQRLSGLLPYQSCYSEFYFSKKLWPDFSKEDFVDAISEYERRKRRYGK